MHLFGAFYFVIVLAVEREWGLPYHELIELWTLGALLVGLGAIPAGWLGDRWSAPGMLVVMFLGMGMAAIGCGLADSPATLMLGLAGIGLFASIYHPVGIAWVVRTATAQGKALGINGIFGNIGVACAGVVTGALIDLFGWRSAFVVPGVVSVLTGLALTACLRQGWVVDHPGDRKPQAPPDPGVLMRAAALLLVAMVCMALVFHGTQAALPKVFDLRLGERVGDGAFGVGLLVATVYGVGGLMQVVGGHLADRYPLKPIYVGGLLLQIPMLVLVGQLAGLPLVALATLAVFFNSATLPAENMLIARYVPAERRGLAYGVKFVLAFGTAPLAVLLVSKVVEHTGELAWVFSIMAALAACAMCAGTLLPGTRRRAAVAMAE